MRRGEILVAFAGGRHRRFAVQMPLHSLAMEPPVQDFARSHRSLVHRSHVNLLGRMPVDGDYRISSGFGMRWHPILKREGLHKGVDIAAPKGTPVCVTGDGVVSFTGIRGGYGNVVIVDHGEDRQTLYAHLQAILVREGAKVKAGEAIATVGATGRVTGAHLHYEVRRGGIAVDPGLA